VLILSFPSLGRAALQETNPSQPTVPLPLVKEKKLCLNFPKIAIRMTTSG
jgi:hypothetical protein